jgi:hypothetical protein
MPAFISHSFKDEAIYSAICLALDGAGIDRWDPATMTPGDSLSDQLRKAISGCEACIFLATRSSIESPWCLAEVGAFWGSGKTVIIFLADPDLTDSILPPQFRGHLMARNAHKLIEATRNEIVNGKGSATRDLEFFETSIKFPQSEWQRLLQAAETSLDIMGIALMAWRQTPDFREIVMRKASEGCKIRILMMHLDNPILALVASDSQILQAKIPRNYAFFQQMAKENSNIEVRQLKHGLMYSFITRTDQQAVLVQFLASQMWGKGPLWKCGCGSRFYEVAKTEFEALWGAATGD